MFKLALKQLMITNTLQKQQQQLNSFCVKQLVLWFFCCLMKLISNNLAASQCNLNTAPLFVKIPMNPPSCGITLHLCHSWIMLLFRLFVDSFYLFCQTYDFYFEGRFQLSTSFVSFHWIEVEVGTSFLDKIRISKVQRQQILTVDN